MEKENLGGNRLTQVHLEKWPLKRCVCVYLFSNKMFNPWTSLQNHPTTILNSLDIDDYYAPAPR